MSCNRGALWAIPLTKLLTSSLLRTLYTGSVVVFQDGDMRLFKVERKQLEVVQVPVSTRCKTAADRQRAEREFLFCLGDYLKPEPRQWVIVADAASLALRNIDDLLPPDLPGSPI